MGSGEAENVVVTSEQYLNATQKIFLKQQFDVNEKFDDFRFLLKAKTSGEYSTPDHMVSGKPTLGEMQKKKIQQIQQMPMMNKPNPDMMKSIQKSYKDLMEKNSAVPSYAQEKNRGIENLANTPKTFTNRFFNADGTVDRNSSTPSAERGEALRRNRQAEYNNEQENIYGSQFGNLGDAGNRNTSLSNTHAVGDWREQNANGSDYVDRDGNRQSRGKIRGAQNTRFATMDGKVQDSADEFTAGPETDYTSGGVLQNTAYGQDPRIVQKVPRGREDSSYDVGPEGRVQTGEPMDLAFRLLKGN